MVYEKARQLLFRHVNIVTNIKRARHLVESEFVTRRSAPPSSETNLGGQGQLIYSGYLKAVDPVSKSVILCSTDRESVTRNILILGQNICDVYLSQSLANSNHGSHEPQLVERMIEADRQLQLSRHPYFYRPRSGSDNLTGAQLEKIQLSIMGWFNEHIIPIERDSRTGELIVAESVRIRPPYEHESDYISPTRVTLKRIKHMVDSRPR